MCIRQIRKELRLHPTLHKLFVQIWDAADTQYARLKLEGYMNFHLTVTHGVCVELSPEPSPSLSCYSGTEQYAAPRSPAEQRC